MKHTPSLFAASTINTHSGKTMSRLLFSRTPIAWAASALLAGLVQAQALGAPDTFSSKETQQQQGGIHQSPAAYTSFAQRVDSPVAELRMRLAATSLPADGQTLIPVEVTLIDGFGQAYADEVEVSLETAGGAKILPETGGSAYDANALVPATQVMSKNGRVSFSIQAPAQAADILVRASVHGKMVTAQMTALPAEQEMFAVGLIDVEARGRNVEILPPAENDEFQRVIKNWRSEFGNGKGTAGARAAVYLKGMITGKTLLTLSYDSEKDTRDQLFANIDPDALYPVYADNSIRGIDGQSASKLYARLDRGRSNLLYGDYTTSSTVSNLANYSRSLTGLKGHLEAGIFKANAWVSHNRDRQVVDEYPGRGVSGPYSVTNPNGVKGSEKVELIVRDRYQVSRILKTTTLRRESDYEFEPFNGRLLFKSPVPSIDSLGNPVFIRTTYEVEQSEKRHAVAGVDLSAQITPRASVGVSVAKDQNKAAPYQLTGLRGELSLSNSLSLRAETAKSKGAPSSDLLGASSGSINDSGSANSLELTFTNDATKASVYVGKADEEFRNPNARITAGRSELAAQGALKISPKLALNADIRSSKDDVNKGKSTGSQVGVEYQATEKLKLSAGIQQAKQDAQSIGVSSTLACGSGYNAGFGINPANNQGIDPSTGLSLSCANNTLTNVTTTTGTVKSNALFAGAQYDINKKWGLFAQLKQDRSEESSGTESKAATYALGGEYRPYDLTRVYLRHERTRGQLGLYGLGLGATVDQTTLGVDTEYMRDGHLFSEYRLRDNASGREVQNAIGLRNGFNVRPGLKLLTNAELLRSKSSSLNAGADNLAKAIGLGVEYTANPKYKTSGRLEWRDDNTATNVLGSVGLATRVHRDWTLMARQYTNLVKPDSGGKIQQNRTQLGGAYRPEDNSKFDALTVIEFRNEKNGTNGQYGTTALPKRNVAIASLSLNYHPTRPWWFTSRIAVKNVNETLPAAALNSFVSSKYNAALLGLGARYDLSNRINIGMNLNMLTGSGNEGGLAGTRYAIGPEIGYILKDNIQLVGGYTFSGFRDKDLAEDEYTSRGWYMGLRWKFDETVFSGNNAQVNKTLTPIVP